jgi:putative AbiEi antitoxin of type IV toxin-antitoxin system
VRALPVVLRIANTQFGVVTRRQLLAHDVSDHQLRHLLQVGALETAHPGVYLVAGSSGSVERDALAACLACGHAATASFTTSGAIMRVLPAPDVIDVTVPHARRPKRKAPTTPGSRSRRRSLRVHRTTVLGELDVVERGPLRFTSAARTLVDLSSCFERKELTLTTDEVLRRRLTSAKSLLRYLDRPSIRTFPGTGVLRAIVLDRLEFGLPDTGFEALMIELLDEYGLPRPSRQYWALATGRRVRFDLAYPEERVVIELDGWDPHSAFEQWQSDHERDNAVQLAGYQRLGFTWKDVNHRRPYVAATVGEILGLRPSRWVATSRRSATSSRSAPRNVSQRGPERRPVA